MRVASFMVSSPGMRDGFCLGLSPIASRASAPSRKLLWLVLAHDEPRLMRSGDRSLLPLPACGERVGVRGGLSSLLPPPAGGGGGGGGRGTLARLGLAESPPHPDRKNDPTSPRKR